MTLSGGLSAAMALIAKAHGIPGLEDWGTAFSCSQDGWKGARSLPDAEAFLPGSVGQSEAGDQPGWSGSSSQELA